MRSKLIKNTVLGVVAALYLPLTVSGQMFDDDNWHAVQAQKLTSLQAEQEQFFLNHFNQANFKLDIIDAQENDHIFKLSPGTLIMQSYRFLNIGEIKQSKDIISLIDANDYSRRLNDHTRILNRKKPSDLRLGCKPYFIILASETEHDLDQGALYLNKLCGDVYVDPTIDLTGRQTPVNLIYGQYCYYR